MYDKNQEGGEIMRCDIEEINKLDWKRAKGVKSNEKTTNSMLCERDYGVSCKEEYVILITNGVWNWYCTTHHQPASHCERDKMKLILDENCLVILPKNRNKHMVDEYGRPTVRLNRKSHG